MEWNHGKRETACHELRSRGNIEAYVVPLAGRWFAFRDMDCDFSLLSLGEFATLEEAKKACREGVRRGRVEEKQRRRP